MSTDVHPDSIAGSFFNQTSDATAAQKLQDMSKQRAILQESPPGDGFIALPNGVVARLSDIIDHDYVSEDHTSIFNDVEKNLKSPMPGAQYCWAAKDDPNTYGRERRGEYRRVAWDELREDTSLPLTTHVGPTGEYCCVYDLVLMEMPPEVVRRKRKWPAQAALLRTVRGMPFKQMKEGLSDFTGGGVRAEMDVKLDSGATTSFE